MADRPLLGECVIALDVGGTGMKGALLDRGSALLVTERWPTPRAHGPEAVVDAIVSALRSLALRAAEHGLAVRRAGVVVPGIVDTERSLAVYSANIGWRDLPLASVIEERTGLPVTLGHDVRAGALAEVRLGAARGAQDALFVAIGTGISAALVSDGRLLAAGGYAGELGHLVVEPDGRLCPCGNAGCLETVASAAGIAMAYTALSGHTVAGADEVAARLTEGDEAARAVWARAVEGLATALTAAVTLLAPEVVVLGGGLAESGDLLLGPLRARLDEKLTFHRRPHLVAAALGDRAGCLGAGLHAWDAADVMRAVPCAPAERTTHR
ncbi:ROK family protein [Kitasatospora sp. NBC_00240]|uniref:ROK family protein n=1 Tax=Kitasatospora sp. NBC_00240 TaxID=2903567 RepID=UPI0022581937|nr:ROK family protein [Kitasatospora sp. NBC_00240]MCX5214504.1 ROK family protein [Kitasatospora sp. NBC_00240]